jgi:hypothetical protein
MALPEFGAEGALPPGTHRASRREVLERFGDRGRHRTLVSQRLERILDRARAVDQVERVIILGSYVTAKEAPGDVDLLLVMSGDVEVPQAPEQARVLFDHQRAEAELGAHIFWLRSPLGQELIEQLIRLYAINRDGIQQGVVEID